MELLRAQARDSYRFDVIRWCLTAPYIEKKKRPKPPAVPDILKEAPSAKS